MERRKQGRKQPSKKKWLRWWMLPVGTSILVWILFHTVFLAGYVPTESMELALKKGSFLIASRVYSRLGQGDVIVFRRNGDNVNNSFDSRYWEEMYVGEADVVAKVWE